MVVVCLGYWLVVVYFVKQVFIVFVKVFVYFLCEVDGIGVIILYEICEESFRVVKVIQENIINMAGSDSYENLCDLVWVCWIVWDVDDW